MTNYVDPDATRPVTIGPCRCPGTPHATDTADIVRLFGYGERARIRQAARLGGVEQSYLMAILLGVKRWNLVLPDASARPIDDVQVARLDETTVLRLLGVNAGEGEDQLLGEAFAEEELPLASAAPSPSGSQESGTPTPTTQTPPSSTST